MKKILVSDLFVEIYKNFNLLNVTKDMTNLSERELLILLLLTIDKFDQNDKFVCRNWSAFEVELIKINNFLDKESEESDEENTEDSLLREVCKIYLDDLIDSNDNPLPNPLTTEEAIVVRRQMGISEILND